MPPLVEKTPEKANSAGEYQAELSNILNRQLVPEVIDTYADQALNDLVVLVQGATETFASHTKKHFETTRDLETAAFAHYKLGNVESILDHIAGLADQIRSIDHVINRAKSIDRVISPPDPAGARITEGDGSFEKKKDVPRLKTTLFVLAHDFGLDINDPEQVSVTSGIVRPDMMRRSSYYCVQAETIDRTILVCDEAENATYVFDSAKLSEANITNDDLLGLTKSEKDELLAENPVLGTKLKYTASFVTRLSATICEPGKDPAKIARLEAKLHDTYLLPQATDDIATMSGIARGLVIDKKIVTQAIGKLKDDLGEVLPHNFNGSVHSGYTPYQQAVIENHFFDRGMLVEEAPEGVIALSAFVKAHQTFGYEKAKAAVEELSAAPDYFGEVKTYRFKQARVPGFTPAQQDMLLEYLMAKQELIPEAPEGYRSMSGLANFLGIDKKTIGSAVKRLGGMKDETETYRFGKNDGTGYSPEQQARIIKALKPAVLSRITSIDPRAVNLEELLLVR
ncbi:hypothetical protein HGB25_00555 [Candidatus Saccharibacteria bacterium]|nr:hypothetical protein [Candidatus Saccharibacteria bacterium]